ncbi:MAG: hypothetical protein AB1488_02120 [Nitrospirota bacterium]
MSYYFRHIKDNICSTGIEITKNNKKDIDRAIHEIVGVNFKSCPNTWKKGRKIKGNERLQ